MVLCIHYGIPNISITKCLLISDELKEIALHIYYIGHACVIQFHNNTTPGEHYHQTSNTSAPNAKTKMFFVSCRPAVVFEAGC